MITLRSEKNFEESFSIENKTKMYISTFFRQRVAWGNQRKCTCDLCLVNVTETLSKNGRKIAKSMALV